MASLAKRCRHRDQERENCRCTWYIRYRIGKREHYINAGPDLDDARRLLDLHRESPPKPREVTRAPGLSLPKQNGEPWTYFVAGAGLVKIGTTTDLDERMRSLQVASPVALHLMLVIDGGRSVERKFHDLFKDRRRHGEWFALPVGWENDPRLREVTV